MKTVKQPVLYRKLTEKQTGIKRPMSFMPTQLMICTLPLRSLTGKNVSYKREYNGNMMEFVGKNGVPGGRLARLIVMLLTTAVVNNKNNVDKSAPITLYYKSFRDFQEALGMESNRSKELMGVMEMFVGCNMYFTSTETRPFTETELFGEDIPQGGYAKAISMENVPFISKLQVVEVLDKNKKTMTNVEISIIISKDYAEKVENHAIPVDYEVYRNIISPLEKDMYVWLVYKNNIQIKKEGQFIPRKNLLEQFLPNGDGALESANYQRITEAINNIKNKYYPGLQVSCRENHTGITLFQSPKIIQGKDTRYVPLINSYT